MAWKIRSTASCSPGKRSGSARVESRGFRNARTSSAQINSRRRSKRAMQSEPHSSGHGIPLLGNAMSRAKIHRGCTNYFMRTVNADKNAVSPRRRRATSRLVVNIPAKKPFGSRRTGVFCATQDDGALAFQTRLKRNSAVTSNLFSRQRRWNSRRPAFSPSPKSKKRCSR